MGGGGEQIKIPDWKIYKVEGIPELEQTQRLLAARGLKDPWLRNEVWRYTPENYGGKYFNARKSVGRGIRWAFGAVALTVLVQKYVLKKCDDDGDHH